MTATTGEGTTMTKPLGPVFVLKQYFGKLPDQSLRDFADEIKALADDDKAELVALAAAELGVEVAQ